MGFDEAVRPVIAGPHVDGVPLAELAGEPYGLVARRHAELGRAGESAHRVADGGPRVTCHDDVAVVWTE